MTAVVVAIVLTGCTRAESLVEERPSATTTESTSVDLEALVLDVADLPTGGWVLESQASGGAETSTDKEDLGPCFLDLAATLPELEDDSAERQFAREATSSQLFLAVIRPDDPVAMVERFRVAMEPCVGPYDATRSGQASRVVSEPLSVPAVGGADALECRRVEMTVGYTSVYGHICLAAVGDVVTSAMTLSRYASVEDEELVTVLAAAVEKAATG